MGINVFIDAFYVSGPINSLVFLVLIVMSILSWGLILATAVYFRKLAAADLNFLQRFNEAEKPLDLYKSDLEDKEQNGQKIAGVKAIFREIYKEVIEIEQHVVGLNFIDPRMQTIKNNFDEIIQRTLEKVKSRENNKRERFFGFFATTSNIAPFIGLLGTVIGIIDAFVAIAKAGSADLGFVAPAISEALVATALGLFVAIPASVAFNYFKAKSFKFRETFDHFTLDLLNRIQQQYFFVKIYNEPGSQEGN
ncbi:MAG: MotA/TolQ/ExbB proton channel family protein [Proteobacteria bacterium]|nr:MotA/TolQ/ExbB proton channel family protein [Pseudomonadota bacterium]